VGHLLERPVALVDIEEIRGVEPADIDVQRPSLFTSTKVAPCFQIIGAAPLSPTPAFSVTSSNLKLPRLRKSRQLSVLLTTKMSGRPSPS
jgi:hypothetical protein